MTYERTRAFLGACRPGQVLLPAIFVVPSLLLFVYLLFETTKLSREKIRHQFAVDSAAFIQMGDYTNLFNRTAYVNGAFPYRIFKETYECTACPSSDENNCLQRTDESGSVCAYDMLYDAGAYPKYTGDVPRQGPVELDDKNKWEIKFDNSRSGMNSSPADPGSVLQLITKDQGIKIYIFWSPAVGIYKFYAQVYTLLGTVEESQLTVFERLTENFNFFRKSYYLNANTAECVNDPAGCAEEGVSSPGGFKVKRLRRGTDILMHYLEKVEFFAKVPQSGLPPYYLGRTNPPLQMPDPGLFQLTTIDKSALDAIGKGYEVYQGWTVPSNYFNVDFNPMMACVETGGRPCVHARVAAQCPQLSNMNNCVWPNPTPKYQTRLYP